VLRAFPSAQGFLSLTQFQLIRGTEAVFTPAEGVPAVLKSQQEEAKLILKAIKAMEIWKLSRPQPMLVEVEAEAELLEGEEVVEEDAEEEEPLMPEAMGKRD
jgi:hypothetical protein